MVMRHSYSSRTLLLSASLLINHAASAPIPIPLQTHPKGETTIWVTSHNTLNATKPPEEQSLQARQWSGLPGGFGPSGGSPQGQSFGPPGDNNFGPSQQPPSVGPPNGPWGPPNGDPYTTGWTLSPWTSATETQLWTSTYTQSWTSTLTTTSIITTSSPAPPPSTTSVISTSGTSSSPPPPPPPPPTTVSEPPTSSTTSTPPPPPPSPTSSPAFTSPSATSTPVAPSTTSTSTPASSPTTSSTSTSSPPPATTSSPLTSTSSSTAVVPTPSGTGSAPPAPSGTASPTGNTLQLSLVNNLGSSNVHAYVTGLDSTGQVVMLTTDGTYYYLPSPGGSNPVEITANVALPLNGPGQTTTLTLPDFITSARVWFADGTLTFYAVDTEYGPGLVEPTTQNPSDPSTDVNWGFIELTFQAGYGLFANLSYVDFVGLPTGIELAAVSSGTQSAMGVPSDAVSQVCNLLKAQAAKDGQPWDDLCMNDANGNLLRVVSPSTLIAQKSSAFENFWDDYITQVWTQYTTEPLMIDTQSSAGNVSCTSDGTTLTCAGDNAGYTKPSAADIFGCNTGPFAISESDNDIHLAVVPRICAAINRATLHLAGGNLQPSLPPSQYYLSNPNNWYAAFVHAVESEGKGYAFSYDDVSPSEADNTSGSVYAADPTVLTVYVGGAAGA